MALLQSDTPSFPIARFFDLQKESIFIVGKRSPSSQKNEFLDQLFKVYLNDGSGTL
jgi:hypothetical protein